MLLYPHPALLPIIIVTLLGVTLPTPCIVTYKHSYLARCYLTHTLHSYLTRSYLVSTEGVLLGYPTVVILSSYAKDHRNRVQ